VSGVRTLCLFTGSRAEYGLLRPLARLLHAAPDVRLQILASGTHLSPEFGLTLAEIEADGLPVTATAEIILSADTPTALTSAMGLGLIKVGEILARLRPDMLVLLGDRFELLAVAAAALPHRIPVAHIHGGEATEGLIDEAVRHAVTKLSHLHFAAAEPYARRIRRMGEPAERVFTVGAPALDNITAQPLADRPALLARLGLGPCQPLFAVTWHPVTLDPAPAEAAVAALCTALDAFPQAGIVFSRANADTQGRRVNAAIDAYAARHPGRCVVQPSLGTAGYLSLLAAADVVLGNSSSGLIEAPSLGTPTVNVGDRQQGRLRAPSVLDCPPEAGAITAALHRALSAEMQALAARRQSPYGTPGASARMAGILRTFPLDGLCLKPFQEGEG